MINNIRFANDTVILEETLEDLQALVDNVNRESVEMDLKINTDKFMVVSKHPTKNCQLFPEEKQIGRVEKYKYLVTYNTSDID